jgi:hypothetical protein
VVGSYVAFAAHLYPCLDLQVQIYCRLEHCSKVSYKISAGIFLPLCESFLIESFTPYQSNNYQSVNVRIDINVPYARKGVVVYLVCKL